MPTRALRSAQSTPVGAEGKVGYVPLRLTVAPEVKDALVDLAIENETSVMAEVRIAIENHLREWQ